MTPLALAVWLFCAPAHAAQGAAEALVAGAENALWDDHVDVRDVCFMLARDGIPAEELVAELEGVAHDAAQDPPLRARARRLLRRLAPAGQPRCRSGEGRAAPAPGQHPR